MRDKTKDIQVYLTVSTNTGRIFRVDAPMDTKKMQREHGHPPVFQFTRFGQIA